METRKSKVKRLISDFLPSNLKDFITQEYFTSHLYLKYQNRSFSKEGEDLILADLFYGLNDGFYIDIGAFHPIHYSNTFKFYLQGWHGINIDARPNSMTEFQKIRPRDINLEIAISDKIEMLDYHIYDAHSLNTFSNEKVLDRTKSGQKSNELINIQTVKLSDILDKYIEIGQEIHFMSVDVEGFELNVLKSNNWNKFRPLVLVIEKLKNIRNKENDIIEKYLLKCGYKIICNTPNNIFLLDEKNEININL